MKVLLKSREARKSFGGLIAINNVSFSLNEGEICGVVGPNGAGKTTLFNLITGVYNLDKGEIVFSGQRIDILKPHKIAELGIARTFQKIRLFKELSVLQNVQMGRHCRTKTEILGSMFRPRMALAENRITREKSCELLRFVDLYEKRNQVAKTLPYGEQRLLELVRAMAVEPKLILLDEPSSGLNYRETEQLIERIAEIRGMGITILIIEHDMNIAMGVTDHIIVLNFGNTLFDGQPKDARNHPDVIKAYLGEEYTQC